LHLLLFRSWNKQASSVDLVLMIEKYPAALQHPDNSNGDLPLHLECYNQCRSPIISKCIELYSQALTKAKKNPWDRAHYPGCLPLHLLLSSSSSTSMDALMMIEKYPQAVMYEDAHGNLPLSIECVYQCRPIIMSKCLELYPDSLNEKMITFVIDKINQNNFCVSFPVLAIVFTACPTSLYPDRSKLRNDIRLNPLHRRQILHLLPRHVFTPTHESDYRDLNWHPRAAMMMLLSQMKTWQRSLQQQ
jgi:hypothetical protein